MKSRLILAGATLALTSALAVAQTAAKPTPYEGVSQPPATDVIHATDTPAPAPVTPSVQQAVADAPATPPPAVGKPAPFENPDYGIVETPVNSAAGAPAASAAAEAPVLQNRNGDPDADIVTTIMAPENTLLAGTALHTRLDEQISSSENGAGTRFTAQVLHDVTQNGRVIIPSGSVVHGKVIHADYGRRIAGPASLRLLANEVVLPDGTRYSMSAVVSQTSRASNTKVTGEGTVLSKDHPARIAAEYGVGGGAGAVMGAAIAGPTGAAVGAGIGLGVITAHVLLEKHAAVLPAGSNVTFGLTQPMTLIPLTSTASR